MTGKRQLVERTGWQTHRLRHRSRQTRFVKGAEWRQWTSLFDIVMYPDLKRVLGVEYISGFVDSEDLYWSGEPLRCGHHVRCPEEHLYYRSYLRQPAAFGPSRAGSW